jgi:hypothetical protein
MTYIDTHPNFLTFHQTLPQYLFIAFSSATREKSVHGNWGQVRQYAARRLIHDHSKIDKPALHWDIGDRSGAEKLNRR